MELTIFLAKIIGVFMLAGGLAGLLHPARYRAAMSDYMKSTIIPVFDGAMALLFGLLIVLTHNLWESLPEIIITLVGWIAVIEGLLILLLPEESVKNMLKGLTTKSLSMVFILASIVIGVYLTYFGFFM